MTCDPRSDGQRYDNVRAVAHWRRQAQNCLARRQINAYIISMVMKPKPPARRGRPALSEGDPTVPVTIRMTEPQRDKLKRLGGPVWVRDRIDKAKEPNKE